MKGLKHRGKSLKCTIIDECLLPYIIRISEFDYCVVKLPPKATDDKKRTTEKFIGSFADLPPALKCIAKEKANDAVQAEELVELKRYTDAIVSASTSIKQRLLAIVKEHQLLK